MLIILIILLAILIYGFILEITDKDKDGKDWPNYDNF
jgi:hypothetical protein